MNWLRTKLVIAGCAVAFGGTDPAFAQINPDNPVDSNDGANGGYLNPGGGGGGYVDSSGALVSPQPTMSSNPDAVYGPQAASTAQAQDDATPPQPGAPTTNAPPTILAFEGGYLVYGLRAGVTTIEPAVDEDQAKRIAGFLQSEGHLAFYVRNE